MKKFLLSTLGITVALSAVATPTMSKKWENSQNGIVSSEAVNYNTPIAVSDNGDVYTTGLFTEAFEFADNELMPIATSSYILKYGVDGSEIWGIAIAGSATIVDTDIDAAGNLYVAGTFADVVSFGSTDDNTIEKEGQKASDNSYYTKQNSSFIAKYNAAGILQEVATFVPTYHPSLASLVDMLYYPMDGDITFHINKIDVVGDKVYCSATYTGETTKDSATFLGGVYDMEGWGFYYMDIESGAVFNLNTNLSDCNVIASVKLTNEFDPVAGMGVRSSTFAVSDSNIYAAFTCANDVTFTIGNEATDYSYATIDADEYVEYGYLIAAIDKATGESIATKSYTTKSSATTVNHFVSDILVSGDNVAVIGTFQNTLPFDANITATGDNDVFVAGLNATDLNSNWNAVSGWAEGDNNKEVACSSDIYHNYIWVNTTTGGNFGGVEYVNSYFVELSDAAAFTLSSPIVTDVAINGKYIALATTCTNTDSVTNVFALFEDENSAICDIEIDYDFNQTVKYYNLQGIEISKENLSSGLYISKQGNKTTKVVIK